MPVDEVVVDVAALQRLPEAPAAMDHDSAGCGECTWDTDTCRLNTTTI